MKRTFGVLGAIAATVLVGRSGSAPDSPSPPAKDQSPLFTAAVSELDSSDFDWEHVTKGCGLLASAYPNHDLNIQNGYSAQAVVAIVPDPARTNLQLFFDRTVESLVWGVGDSNYSLECHSLPWPAGETPNAAPKLFGNDQLYKNREDANAKFPGVIVFRSKQNSQHIMLLFLVGETPTGGVSHDQFETAMKWLPPSADNVKIVGPTFSGSFHSLLEVAAGTSKGFTVRSGSATSGEARVRFAQELKNQHPGSDFSALVFDDDFAQSALIDYVRNEAGETGPIAILSEDDTVYGNIALKSEQKPGDRKYTYLPIRFPREIAHLRNAYRSSVAIVKDGVPAEPLHLPLKLETGKIGTDAIPSYSQDQTPVSNDAVLLSIASSLRREGVRYAGIFATDALDVVFLCRYLREAVPNVRLVIFSSDLLLLRAEGTAPVSGVLAVTTYPLFSRNQHWTEQQLKKTSPRRILFADSYSEGTYNAARSLLAGPDERLLEYVSPIPPHNDFPPLWLAEAGKEAWWPVALLNSAPGNNAAGTMFTGTHTTPYINEAFHPERPSSLFRMAFAFAAGCSFLHLYMLCFRYVFPGKGGSDSLARLLPSYPARNPRPAGLQLIALCFPLAGLDCLIGMPLLRFWQCSDWLFAAAGVTICLLALLLAAAAVTMQFLWMRDEGRRIFQALLFSLAIFAAAWAFLNWNPRENAGLFFAYRNLFPTSGTSPLLPLLIVLSALVHFCWVHLNRVTAISICKMAYPSAGCFHLIGSFADAATGAVRLRGNVGWRRVAGAVAAWLVITWPGWSLWTSDHWVNSVLIAGFFGTLMSAMAMTFFQFQRLWVTFQSFLEQLEKQPFREAFSRLPKEFAGPVWKALPREHVLLISSRCRDSLAAFLSDPHASARLAGSIPLGPIANAIRDIEEQVLQRKKPDPPTYEQLQKDLAHAGDHLVRWLEDDWQKGASDSLAFSEEKTQTFSDTDKTRLCAEEFLAFRCLVVIRHMMRSLRNLLWFLVIGFVLMVLAMEAYPYQAPRSLGFESVAIFLLLGFFIGRTLAQMDRNPVLSRLSNSKPEELSGQFGWRLISAGALPLLTVMGSQFPTVGNWLSSWLEPAMKALK